MKMEYDEEQSKTILSRMNEQDRKDVKTFICSR